MKERSSFVPSLVFVFLPRYQEEEAELKSRERAQRLYVYLSVLSACEKRIYDSVNTLQC